MGDITTLSIVNGTISESMVRLISKSSSLNVAEIKSDFTVDGSTSNDIETIQTMLAQTDTVTSSKEAWPMNTESTVLYSSYGRDVSESSLFLMQHATQELPSNTSCVISLESSQYPTVFWSDQGQILESQMLPSSVILNHDNTTIINIVTVAMDILPKSFSELEQFSSGAMSQSYTEHLLANSDNQDRPSIKQTQSVLKLDTLPSTGYLFNSFEQESTYKTNVPIAYLSTLSSSHPSLDNVSFTESAQTFQVVPSHVLDKLDVLPASFLDYPITVRAPYITYTESSLIVVDSAQLNSTVAQEFLPMTLKPAESSTKGEATILGGGLSDYYLYVGLPLCGVAVLFFLILCIICIRQQHKTRSKGSAVRRHAPDLWVHCQGEVPLITKDSVPEANREDALMVQRDLGCTTYEVVFDFNGDQSSHLSLKEGDQVKVHRKETNGWWQGTDKDPSGWFPNDCVHAASHDEVVIENEVETPSDTQISSFMIKRNDMPTNSLTYPTENNIKVEHTYCKVAPKHKSETKNSECSSSPTKSESSVQSVPQPFQSTLPGGLTKFVVLYSHVVNCMGQLSISKGDVILCADHELNGWTHGYNEATQMEGWVPSSYIEKMAESPSWDIDPKGYNQLEVNTGMDNKPDLAGILHRALHKFSGEKAGDLLFEAGELITVVQVLENGWFLGCKDNVVGWFPGALVEMIDQPSSNCTPSPVSVSTITQSSLESLVPADNIPVGAAVSAQDPPASDTLSKASTQSAKQPPPKPKLKPLKIAPVPSLKVTSTVESKIPTVSNRTPKLDRPIIPPPLPPTINFKHADSMTDNKDSEQNENQQTYQTMSVNDINTSNGALQDLKQQPDNIDSNLVLKRGTAKPHVPTSYIKPELISVPKHEIKMPDVEAGPSDLAKYRPPPPKPMTPKLGLIRDKFHAPEPLEDQSAGEDETVFQVTPQQKFLTLMKQESAPESPVAVCRDLSSFGSTFDKHQDHPAVLVNDDKIDFNIPAKDAGSDSKNLVKTQAIVNSDDDSNKIENTYKVERQNNERNISVNSNEIVSNISKSLVKSSKLHPPKPVTAKPSAVSVVPADTVLSGSALLAADSSSDKPSKLPRSHTDSGSKYPFSKVESAKTQTKEGILQCAFELSDSPKEEYNPDKTYVKEIAGELPKNVESHNVDVHSEQARGNIMGKPLIAPKPKSGLPKLQLKLKPGALTRETDVKIPNADSNINVHSPSLPFSLPSEKTESVNELDAQSDIGRSEVSMTPMGSAVMPQSPKHLGRKSQIPSSRMKNKSTNKGDYPRINNNKLSESDGDQLVSPKTNLTNETAESLTLSKIPPPKPVNTFVRQRSDSPANRTSIPLSMRNRSNSPSLPVANCTPAVQAENPASGTNSTVVKTTNIPIGLVPPKKIVMEQEELSQHPSSDILSGQNIDDLDTEHQKLDRPSKLLKMHKDQSKEGKSLKRGKSLLPVVHKMVDTGAGSSNGVAHGNTATKLESAIPLAKQARLQLTQQTLSMANDDNCINKKTTLVHATHGLSAPHDNAV